MRKSFYEKLKEKCADISEYEFLSIPRILSDTINVRHLVCNHEYQVSAHNFLNGRRCPYCAAQSRINKRRLSTNDFMNRLNSKFTSKYGPDSFIAKSEYTGNKDKITVVHSCGNIISDRSAMYILSHGCSKCNLERKRLNHRLHIEDIQNKINLVYPQGEYTVTKINLEKYNRKISVRHICGIEREYSLSNLLSKKEACPCICTRSSIGERELQKFIQENCKYNIINNKHFGNIYELDIFIQDLHLGIEYNGLYWHSDNIGGVNNLLAKTEYFKSLGIHVIHIFEDEWKNQKQEVQTKLQSILNGALADTDSIDLRWYNPNDYISAGYEIIERIRANTILHRWPFPLQF